MDLNTALRAIIEGKDEGGRPGRGVPPANAEAARGQAESGDVKTSAEELAALLSRVSEAPTREIEKLINQLQRLRTQLENAGNRIQRDIAQYTELSQQTIQLTAIITDSVKKLPDGTRQAHRVLQ